MTDGELLQEYINLENSCLTKGKKKEVMDMIHKYKGAFSLRDEVGTCPNIVVEIDVMDKSSFFIKTYHVNVRRQDTNWQRNEMFVLFMDIKGRILTLL